jgi:hypothetical protein
LWSIVFSPLHGVGDLGRLLRGSLWSFIFAAAVWTAGLNVASACERCLRLGVTTHSHAAVGGDMEGDAIELPAPPADERNGETGPIARYLVSGSKWPQPGGLGSPVTITYSYNNVFDGGLRDASGTPLPASLIRGSIEEALGLWASVAPLHFVEVPDEGGGPFQFAYPDGQFGQIRFNHIFINGPDPPGGTPIAKAIAYFPNLSSNLGGDVFFDRGDPWQEVGTLPRPDILGAAIHELGHSLGLHHSEIEQANMYWIFRRYSGLGTGRLHEDDIMGIRAIYGAGVGSLTPLAIPEPAAIVVFIAAALGWLAQRGRRKLLETPPDVPERG